MKWHEVRNIYPNQFVKFEILKSHLEDDKKYIDEVAVIGPVHEADATKELLSLKGNTLVYHTSNDQVILIVRKRIGLRRSYHGIAGSALLRPKPFRQVQALGLKGFSNTNR